MPANRERERLARHLDFFAGELADFWKFAEYSWNDYQFDKDKRRNLERWIENLVNSTIDMAKLLLAGEDFPMPQTYKEVLFAFGARYFHEDFGKKIETWAVLRNIVAHDYLDIRWNSIKTFISVSRPLLEDIHRKVKEILLQGENK